MAVWNPVRLSAMHQRHLELGATMVDEGGWQRPARYTTADEELEAIARGVGLCDLSPAGKLYLQGAELGSVLEWGGNVPAGRVVTTELPDAAGSPIGDVLICHTAEEQVMVVTGTAKVEAATEALEALLDGCAHLVQMTSAMACIALAGPGSEETLAKLTELDVSARGFPDLSCAWAGVALVHTLVVRADTGGQPCYQLYVPRDLGEFVWDAVMVAGHHADIAPFGLEALRRLEVGG